MQRETGSFTVKSGLAEMLKGGVIMDVTTAEQAKIAEDAGACAVMALERVPADIRRDGRRRPHGRRHARSRRSSRPSTIPVMAKARIGHFVEAQSARKPLGVDYIDESEVLTPADEEFHIDKWAFTVPFVCGARNLGEALRRIAEGARDDPHQGRGRHGQRGGSGPARSAAITPRDRRRSRRLRPEQYVTEGQGARRARRARARWWPSEGRLARA